jgi:large subunit ribosomal protein L28
MGKECDICGKKPVTGNNVSHSNRHTKRRWEPNLHKLRLMVNGSIKRVRICTVCLKTAAKKSAI